MIKDDYLLTNKRYFSTDIEQGVTEIRRNFRVDNMINEDAYAIFVAPGNEPEEASFCMENLRKGIKEFLLKYSAPTSISPKALPLEGNFVTILSLHEGSKGAAWVK